MSKLARLFLPLALALSACANGFAGSPPPLGPIDAPPAPLLLKGQPAAAPARMAPVILISIDGFRADYLSRDLTPHIAALAADGVRAERMRPSYPSLTFPNHYTLVTGLRPDQHGIVDNTMQDPGIPGVTFTLGNHDATADRRWWDDAEPLWVTAKLQGLDTATMFWPGSEAEIHGVRPDHFLPYDKKMTAEARVDTVLGWLDLPPGPRPDFITLYFDRVDTAGHDGGPDSEAVNTALAETDAAVGRLIDGLKARGLYDQAEIVIVADHGMAATGPERVVFLDDFAPADSFKVFTSGAGPTVMPTPGRETEAAPLVGKHPHLTCWAKAKVPAQYHFGSHRRVPPIVCLAETGWWGTTHDAVAKRAFRGGGSHGFDPYDPQMGALFVAHGPAFRKGVVLKPFDNVDVYPLLASLLGVTPQKNDGDLRDLKAGLN